MPAPTRTPAAPAVTVEQVDQVTFLLDRSGPRRKPLRQTLWMRPEGRSVRRIARAVGKPPETVQFAIDAWQRQVELSSDEPFAPLAVCPRRQAGRSRRSAGASPI